MQGSDDFELSRRDFLAVGAAAAVATSLPFVADSPPAPVTEPLATSPVSFSRDGWTLRVAAEAGDLEWMSMSGRPDRLHHVAEVEAAGREGPVPEN